MKSIMCEKLIRIKLIGISERDMLFYNADFFKKTTSHKVIVPDLNKNFYFFYLNRC